MRVREGTLSTKNSGGGDRKAMLAPAVFLVVPRMSRGPEKAATEASRGSNFVGGWCLYIPTVLLSEKAQANDLRVL